MKKILLLFVFLLFSVTNANASTVSVKYNNAGAPTTITRGYGPAVSAARLAKAYGYRSYARPARYAMPARPAMPYGYRTRHAQLPPPLMNYNSIAPLHSATNTTTTSRLSKDYNITPPQKSYTMNGVTYYN